MTPFNSAARVQPGAGGGGVTEKRSQCQRIIDYLATGAGLTPLVALHRFGTLRLSGRILELRQRGHQIRSTMVERHGARVAEYRLDRAGR